MSKELTPEFWKSVNTQIDEILTLKKSMDQKMMKPPMAKAADPAAAPFAEETPATDPEADAMHAADEGADPESLESYAAKLSPEEIQTLISVLQGEEGRRGSMDPAGQPGAEPGMDPAAADPLAESADPAMDPSMDPAMADPAAAPMDPAMDPGMDPAADPAMDPAMADPAAQQPGSPEGAIEAAGALDESVAALSDEEINSLMAALQQESEMRAQGGQPQGAAQPPVAGPEAAAKSMDGQPPMDPMAMSKSKPGELRHAADNNPSKRTAHEKGVHPSVGGAATGVSPAGRTTRFHASSQEPKAKEHATKQHQHVIGEQKNMKPAALGKSLEETLQSLNTTIASVNTRLAKLEKSGSVAAVEPSPVPASRIADPKVRVLEKSSSEAAGRKMVGNEIADWLYSEQKKGNRLVKSLLVAEASLAKSFEEVDAFYEKLQKIGLPAPLVKE